MIQSQIIELIQSDEYPLGSRLPSERQLAERFNVGRNTIRDAKIELEMDGFIKVVRGSGTYVASRTGHSCLHISAYEVTEARALFEAEVAALATKMVNKETIEQLDEYLDIISGNEPSNLTHHEADAAFHRLIARATKNPAIIFAVDNLWLMRDQSSDLQSISEIDAARHHKEHEAIVKALKDRDPHAARKAMRIHFTGMIEDLLDLSEKRAKEKVTKEFAENRFRFSHMSDFI